MSISGASKSGGTITNGPYPDIPPNLDIVTDSDGLLTGAFPTILSLPRSKTIQWNYVKNSTTSTNLNTVTVPAGYYGSINSIHATHVAGTGNASFRLLSTVDFVTYQIASTISTIAVGSTGQMLSNGYTFGPGETMVLVGSVLGSTYSYNIYGYFYPINSSNINPIVVKGLVTGDQTVWTCPTGYNAVTLANPPAFITTGIPRVGNLSGVSVTIRVSHTLGGVTAQIASFTTATNTIGSGTTYNPIFAPGDTISVNSTVTSTQLCFFITVALYPLGTLLTVPTYTLRERKMPLLPIGSIETKEEVKLIPAEIKKEEVKLIPAEIKKEVPVEAPKRELPKPIPVKKVAEPVPASPAKKPKKGKDRDDDWNLL